MAPEYATKGRLSTKADVFSFGILILETISNCRHYIHREDMTLLQYAWTNWLEGTSSNITDPTIHADSSSITRFIHIWLLCVQANPADRPTMEEVVAMLTNTSSHSGPIPKKPIAPWMIEENSDYIDAQTHDYDSGAVEELILEVCPR
ncbi:hypothetical protein L1887_04557 [Cichorium endivia]|nr:hypothetical protein L1887_04557 [Cichorium endivia]